MNKVIYATDETFENEVINNDAKVLVDFYADWCGPCKAIAPLLDEISEISPVKIVKLNVDQNPLVASHYGIRSIPTMHLFENGKVTDTIVGADVQKIQALTK